MDTIIEHCNICAVCTSWHPCGNMRRPKQRQVFCTGEGILTNNDKPLWFTNEFWGLLFLDMQYYFAKQY